MTRSVRPRHRRPFISILLHVLRALGVFRLAQFVTRTRLRILGYHGIAVGDLHEFAPFLFMQADTFRGRLEILRRRRLRVISLDDAIGGLRAGDAREAGVVITIDDGWWSTLQFAAPLLVRFGYPATLYLSTRHAFERSPVAPVVLGYMFWKRNQTRLELSGVDPSVDGAYELGTVHSETHLLLEGRISRLDSAAQARMLRQTAEKLGLDTLSLLADKRFFLIALDDIRTLERMGVDTQLHTHSHFMPDELAQLREQLEQNRQHIRMYKGRELPWHFCYPSGRHTNQHAQWLEQLDVVSATTCEPGMNDSRQSPYVLRRFLDSESISDIEFEAQVCGVFEMAKLLRASVGSVLGR
jgi:peptidoglycan/xylan/chitin deacetylase (PgdA/CDA1 family)